MQRRSDGAGAPVAGVSETARWVAVYRAWESARRKPLFHDPYAARLAGSRGEEIARTMAQPGATGNGWPIITRTKLIDDMVLASVADGTTCVLNLAAGLDTRAYRLELPQSLTWIEADLPEILDHKEQVLGGEKPRCALERVRVDLADADRRAALFDEVDARASRVLVITEGLVIYLDEATVTSLAEDLAARPHFSEWVLDVSSPRILKMMQRGRQSYLANAPLKFATRNGVAFFEALGWQAREVHSLFHEGARLRRVPFLLRPFALLPPPDPRAPGNRPWSAAVRFERPAG